MITNWISKLFLSEKDREEKIKGLKINPNFKSRDEIHNRGANPNITSYPMLKKGKIQSIFTPDLGTQKDLTIKKWYFEVGDIVKRGDIVCDIENENITMEFESIFDGKIIAKCKLNQSLTLETELFKIEGIKN